MPVERLYRTVVTRLDPAPGDRDLLERTIDEWRRGCQLATDLAWNECSQRGDVQALAYEPIRAQTELGSQHAILATRQAAEAIQGCIGRFRRGKAASKPTFTAPTVTYDARSMTLFEDGTVSLATVEDRVRCPLGLPDDPDGYQWQYLNGEDWSVTESTLTVRDDGYLLHIGLARRAPEGASTAEGGAVLGVDLGVANLAVTSTARFFSGRELSHRRREFEKRRASLQRRGTRSARLTLAGLAERETRLVRDRLHCVSKAIVAEAADYGCSVIALERLAGIRSQVRQAGWFDEWAFRRLSHFIEYKARARGMQVEYVAPRGTSRTCSKCGHGGDENRPDRDRFECAQCGYRANADYNAAKNVALRYVRRDQQSSGRTGTSRCALKSGTLTPNGTYSPYPADTGAEVESADKSPG